MSEVKREPGWYPDRNDPDYNRYWNGRAWTARRHPVGAPPPPVGIPAPADPPATSAQGAPAERKKRIPIWMWVICALLLMRTLFSLMATFSDNGPGTHTAVPSQPAVVSPSPRAAH